MKTFPECIPCFIRQVLDAARTLSLSDEDTRAALREALETARNADWNLPAPITGRDMHRITARQMGTPDPFAAHKRRHTQTALDLLPRLQQTIHASPDPFGAAVQFAVAGNAIDLGVTSAHDPDVDRAFAQALQRPLNPAGLEDLRHSVEEARSVLFLADNAGEIVFDIPLLERIGLSKLTVAVRGRPILNDATMEDAQRSGLTGRFTVIDNGSDVPGTWLPDCRPSFRAAFAAADLIISKGQGNFETLSEVQAPIIFVFLAKCPVVARMTGEPVGTAIVKRVATP